MKKDIRTYSLEDLQKCMQEYGHPAYRSKQLYDWIWKKGCHDFEEMTNLSKDFRNFLKTQFTINNIQIHKMQRSKDGTIKNAIKLHDGLLVESVMIPTSSRTTACVSSQVGCSLDCNFCATASIKRMRNLNADEIFDQVITIDKQSREYQQMSLKNIVFMGMGEPLMNYNNVLKAIDKITSISGLGMSPSRITLSTSGIPKMIKKMADDGVKFNLAVSLHSAIETTRNKLMPFTQKFPLEELRESIQYWYRHTNKMVTYEYVIWKDINDTLQEARALAAFCLHTPSKVNLIQYNSIEKDGYQQASYQSVVMYQQLLESKGITVNVRRSRGQDIDAACGQLANKE